MRRVAALALLVVLTGLALGVPADGARAETTVPCPALDVNLAAKSAAIFDGQVIGAPIRNRQLKASIYVVRVKTSLKGTATGKVKVALIDGPCNAARRKFSPSEDYYFFVNPSTQGTGWIAPGTAPTVVRYNERITAQLHQLLDRQTPPAPAPVSFGQPSADRPSSFTRVAAPGAALLIVGILGYVVVRRLGRRPA